MGHVAERESNGAIAGLLANIVDGWGRAPRRILRATAPGGISAALWSHAGEARAELSADPPQDFHILALRLSATTAELSFSGRLVHSGTVRIGSLSLLRAGDVPRLIVTGPWQILHIYIPVRVVERVQADEQVRQSLGKVDLEGDGNIVDPSIERHARQILLELTRGFPFAQARADCLGQDLAIQLLRRQLPPCVQVRGGRSASDSRFRRAVELIEDRLGDNLGLGELAAAAGVSAVHLTNLFRQTTGMPPHQWIVERRLEKAQALLQRDDLTITEVAFRCGFATSQHMAATFRKRFGATPTDYRRAFRL